MKKKIMLTATAAALAVMMVVGGTIAWFTDSKEATNVITMGNVKIDLLDYSVGESDGLEGTQYTDDDGTVGLKFENIVPGATLSKVVEVENTGNNDAYVRVKVNNTGLEINFNDVDWTLSSDGYYYYITALKPGATTNSLFTTVGIPGDLTNTDADKTFNIEVLAEAVQADNRGDDAILAFSGVTIE